MRYIISHIKLTILKQHANHTRDINHTRQVIYDKPDLKSIENEIRTQIN